MRDWPARFEANKSAATLLVLFIPSVDRDSQPIAQDGWVTEALDVLGRCFGGATAFPQGRGVWRDDAQAGELIYDEPVIIECYTSEEALDEHCDALRAFLVRMGTETRQGAVGFVIDRDYLEIKVL
jgi:hypothetical protein